MMAKMEIISVETIDNGYICTYMGEGIVNGKKYKKTYKKFFTSPQQLGRLILRHLDSQSITKEKIEGED